MKPALECVGGVVLLQTVSSKRSAVPPITALTSGMARGEEQAFREFYDLYFRRLFAYLLVVSRGEEEQAREALQLALVRVVKHVRRFDDEEVFWSWLSRVARTALLDEGRKRSRYFGLLTRFFQMRPAEAETDSCDQESRLACLLDRSVAELSEEDRDLVDRKYFRGDCVREIAASLGVSEKAIDSRLVRLRMKLKQTILMRLKHENQT
jgi:RNA polymerase sigma-70 factor (ECF subfamily)